MIVIFIAGGSAAQTPIDKTVAAAETDTPWHSSHRTIAKTQIIETSAQSIPILATALPADIEKSPPSLEPPKIPSSTEAVPVFEQANTSLFSWPPEKKRGVHLEATWDNGLQLQSDDDRFHVHIGGNFQIDSTWPMAPNSAFEVPGGDISGAGGSSATFLRRARLRIDGDIYNQFDYILEYDFAHASNENNGIQPPSFSNISSSPTPMNIWLQIREVPLVGDVRIGNQTKPIGFTNQVYQGFLPFMERADNEDAFYAPFDNGNAIGVSVRNRTDNERITWQYGIYRPLTNAYAIGINKGEWGGRVTGLPIYEDEGRELLHLGLGTLNGELPQNELRVRARPLLRNGPGYAVPILVDTGVVGGSRQYTIAPELAAVYGPWTLQAEWTGQFLTDAVASSGQNQGTVFYNGGYAQVLYFLTGEYQTYNKAVGAFGRVTPNNDYHQLSGDSVHGYGAWQLGLRFSYLDLNNKAIQGGTVYDMTLGLNWFLTANMKFQANYILEHRDQPGVQPAWISGLGVRAAYDF